jgi:hypothetical protein
VVVASTVVADPAVVVASAVVVAGVDEAEEDMKMCQGTRNFAHFERVWCLMIVFVICLTSIGLVGIAMGAAAKQKRFPSPEAAVQALMDAAKRNDIDTMLQIFGPEAESFINTGDPVSDQISRARFVQAYEEAHALVRSGDTKVTLQVGKDEWPFPIPLVKDSTSWHFDAEAGQEELLNRIIGRNELDVIQVCLAYVDAQREYYRRNPQRDALLQYAQRFMSTEGERDGLYWETTADEAPSPLGPFLARARTEGYEHTADNPIPYYGYYYKILTGQGPNAPGEVYDYVVRDKMIGGFAMVAYPAQYGSSGIMTFIVNHDGVVYQKDLGPDTTAIAQSMTTFDPDETWEKL